MPTSQRIVEKSDFGPDFIGTLVPNLKLMILLSMYGSTDLLWLVQPEP